MKSWPLILFLVSSSFAQDFCQNKWIEEIPLQQDGRVQPYFVHADQSIRYLTGKTKINGMSSSQLYCQLSTSLFLGLERPSIFVPLAHKDVKTFLKLPESQKSISIEALASKEQEISLEVRKQQFASAYKKELTGLLNKLRLYQDITSGQNWTVFHQGEWTSLAQLGKDFLDPDKIKKSQDEFDELNPRNTYRLESRYFHSHPFQWALALSLMALIATVAMRSKTLPLIFLFLTTILQILGMTMRIFISGRAPVTNMYETVMFSGLGGLVLALILFFTRKQKVYLGVGLAYNICCLMMMSFAHDMLNPHISPLVPVLRDNFWLSTHVTSIVLSYAALALSWVLANFVLFKKSFLSLSSEDERHFTDLIYSCLKYGVVLLSAGLILGGVWADYSWGRFWGWDPKETWALIVLIIYMAILHGKYTSWIPPKRFVPLVAGAFLSVMMAWFGVNYILAAGLHSYGFSEGGALFLGLFFLIQLSWLAISQLKIKRASS